MNRPLKVPLDGVDAVPKSERTVLLRTILFASAVSAATAYLLGQCYSVDVISSLIGIAQDCWLDWGVSVGRHCFSDYSMLVGLGLRPNPWAPYSLPLSWSNNAPLQLVFPTALIPPLLFGFPAKLLGVPELGLLGYLLALTVSVLSPAIWASRGTRGLERAVVFVALGAAAIPVWAAIDRGNSVGFVVPIALVFLVALCRQRWGLVAVTVILAAVIKPHFAVLAVVLLAARQWRLSVLAFAGIAITNVAPFLLWPRYFPGSITQSIHNFFSFAGSSQGLQGPMNISFGKGLLLIPDNVKGYQMGGRVPEGFLAGPRTLIGYVVLLLVVVAVLALGRRIPPVMTGIVLLATAALFPPEVNYYYLVFVLPIAAIIVRDPGGPPGAGIFDQLAANGDRRRVVGVCLSWAAALGIAQIALPGPIAHLDIPGQMGKGGIIGTTPIVATTIFLTPFLWLIASAAIFISYARKPAYSGGGEQQSDQALQADAVAPT